VVHATISKVTLSEVRDLSHSLQVLQHLEPRFNKASLVRSLDVKRMHIDIHLEADQTMDLYLRTIKTIADFLATIQSPISDLELIQPTTGDLFEDYDSFVATFSMLLGSNSFDDLQYKVLIHEQHLNYKKDCTLHIQQVFVATTNDAQGSRGAKGNGS